MSFDPHTGSKMVDLQLQLTLQEEFSWRVPVLDQTSTDQ